MLTGTHRGWKQFQQEAASENLPQKYWNTREGSLNLTLRNKSAEVKQAVLLIIGRNTDVWAC
jgi:hypothetical protein